MTALPLSLSPAPVQTAPPDFSKAAAPAGEFSALFGDAVVPELVKATPLPPVPRSEAKPASGRTVLPRLQRAAANEDTPVQPARCCVDVAVPVPPVRDWQPAASGSAVSAKTAEPLISTESPRDEQPSRAEMAAVLPPTSSTAPNLHWSEGVAAGASTIEYGPPAMPDREAAPAGVIGFEAKPASDAGPARQIVGGTKPRDIEISERQNNTGASTTETLPASVGANDIQPEELQDFATEREGSVDAAVRPKQSHACSEDAVLRPARRTTSAPLPKIGSEAIGAPPGKRQASGTEAGRTAAASKTTPEMPEKEGPAVATSVETLPANVGRLTLSPRPAERALKRPDARDVEIAARPTVHKHTQPVRAEELIRVSGNDTPRDAEAAGKPQIQLSDKAVPTASSAVQPAGVSEVRTATDAISILPPIDVVRGAAMKSCDTGRSTKPSRASEPQRDAPARTSPPERESSCSSVEADATDLEADGGITAIRELANLPHVIRDNLWSLPIETGPPLPTGRENAPPPEIQAKTPAVPGPSSTPEVAVGERLARAAAGKAERPKRTAPVEPNLAFAGRLVHDADTAAAITTRPGAQPASSGERPEKTEEMARASEVDSAPDPPRPAAPAREIRVQVDGTQRVELRMVERGGEVHVAVRTPDSRLAGALRDDLPVLSARLEETGLRAASWHTGQTAGERQAASLFNAANAGSGDRQDRSASDEGRQQQGKQEWKDQQNAPRKEQRKDFQWLFTSLR